LSASRRRRRLPTGSGGSSPTLVLASSRGPSTTTPFGSTCSLFGDGVTEKKLRPQARAWAKGILVDLGENDGLYDERPIRKAGYEIEDDDLGETGLNGISADPNAIAVHSKLPPGRRQFTLCHELAELWRPDRVPPPIGQRFYDLVACHLMLPLHEFIRAIRQHGLNLRALKLRFMHAPMETIAQHLPEAVLNATTAEWEGPSEVPLWRVAGPLVQLRLDVLKAEREAMADAFYLPGGYGVAHRPGVWAFAWRTRDTRPHKGLTLVVVEP
jgi:hypothetical protein